MPAKKIALITDSTCDLPQGILESLNARVLPLKIIYPNRVYNDRVDIEPREVYDRMPGQVPTTSMPSPEETRSLLEKLSEENFTHAVAIHISSGLSGTYETVKTVARQFEKIKVEVIDSKALSLALGFLVQEAGRSIQNGLHFDKVVDRVRQLQAKIKVFFVVKTLEYLKKGGRIGYVEGTVGQILDIKPVISINEEGKYYSYCKVRGRKKSINKLVDIIKELAAGKVINLAVAHGNAGEEAESLLHRITNLNELQVKEVLFGQLGPVMGAHAGPGLIGVAWCQVLKG
ncbi:DegV family protein [Desulfallas sp. Bu1-1]|uniref:DegV family protein n=1 Tax=Desulfallas sp. Bu1-1 TaxID=2787620 RepID=UPI00189DD210|nr:DegV family protein [Desulfallas sp. Bu1-1]MBF7083961.1 DegV family protein [Desulfallas sp. Bu1-1]